MHTNCAVYLAELVWPWFLEYRREDDPNIDLAIGTWS